MDLLIIAVVAAAIGAYFLWGRKPAAASAPASGAAATAAVGTLEDYRRSRPSNFYLGKPTCSHCGSSFVDPKGSCRNCGTTLFRG